MPSGDVRPGGNAKEGSSMRYAVCLLLVAALSPTLWAQEGLTVEVEPVVEGKALPGKEYTLKLRFTVPDGYHAYHKDNPGYSQAVNVTWNELSGLELVKVDWPEPHKHVDEFSEEWELSGVFDIVYTFKVPSDASGTLSVRGHHETQFCDADGCMQSEDDFSTSIEVANADEATAEPEQKGPRATATATFGSTAQAGGKATLEWKLETSEGYHAYHKDNPGYSQGVKFSWTELSGLKLLEEIWPEPKKHVDEFSEEWELPDGASILFVFEVPADAKGELTLKGKWTAQVCDADACFVREGAVTASLAITAVEPSEKKDAKNEHGFYLDFDYGVELARETGKLLLVDFNGKFCGPCRRMEKTIFVLPEVHELMQEFVIVSVQNDIGDARYNELWDQYKPSPGAGAPYYAIFDPAHMDAELRGIASTLPAETRSHEFVAFLKGEAIPSAGTEVLPGTGNDVVPKDWPKGLPGPQPSEFKEHWAFESYFSNQKVRPGGEVSLVLKFSMKSRGSGPFHMYHPASPHALELDMSLFILEQVSAAGLEPTGEWQFPQYHVLAGSDPANNFGVDEWQFGGEFTVVRNFKVPADAQAGRRVVTGTLAGQYCDLQGCIWFTDLDKAPMGWVAALDVQPDGVEQAIVAPSMIEDDHADTTQPDPAVSDTPEDEEPQQEKEDSMLVFLLLTFLGGMVTLLTPCVLPVLPLTISFFVKQSEHKRSPLLTAFIYCTCIVVVFTAFGLLTSILLREQGAQIISTNPYVNIAIGLLFVVFALSFFGLFELRAPAFVTSWLSKKQMKTQQSGNGYATALLSGGSFAVISFSCTGPIAATFLASAASGEFWTPMLAMLFFSSGMALPIFIMGMFPSLLKKLPKSGGWMNALKVTFAFIEIAVAIRYFAWADLAWSSSNYPNFITREVVDAFWIACFAGTGLYLLGLFRMPHDHQPTERLGVVRLLFAMLFLSFAIFMVPGLTRGAPMGMLDGFLPPRNPELYATGSAGGHSSDAGGSTDVHSLKWHQDLDEALAESKATGKPVFVDFTGRICSNCRWVETNIFPRSPVAGKLTDDFILCQQYTDTGDKKANANYKEYGKGGKGVPMYVIVDSDGKMLEKFVPPQFINSLTPKEFAEFMDRGKDKFVAGGS